jgi:hypothetical protein
MRPPDHFLWRERVDQDGGRPAGITRSIRSGTCNVRPAASSTERASAGAVNSSNTAKP